MLNITVEQLIAVCGTPTRRNGSQYYFRCPVCHAGGGDRHGDNLLFNESRGLLKCYACGGERQVLSLINDKFNIIEQPTKYRSPIKVKWYEINKANIHDYYLQTLAEEKPYELIKKHYKWDKDVLEDIGYDSNPHHLFPTLTEPSLIFPVITYDCDIVGFEVRAIRQKEIRHTKDLPNCLAYIKRCYNKLIICEGFKDAVTLNQLYKNIKRDIATPSNGVGALIQCLYSINLNNYEEITLVLDNDKAGNEMTQKILSEFDNIKFKDGRSILKGRKDVWELLN